MYSTSFYKAPGTPVCNSATNFVIENFNALRDPAPVGVPFKSRYELMSEFSYDIKEFQIMDTKYGECLVVELYEPTHFLNASTSDSFKVFLPKRFKLAFNSPSEIEALNREQNLKIRFGNLHDRSTFYCHLVSKDAHH
jgi:hypothetical protein